MHTQVMKQRQHPSRQVPIWQEQPVSWLSNEGGKDAWRVLWGCGQEALAHKRHEELHPGTTVPGTPVGIGGHLEVMESACSSSWKDQ